MAYAQPVPGVTDIAPAGQLFAQAPHSIQRSLSQIMAFLFLIRVMLDDIFAVDRELSDRSRR